MGEKLYRPLIKEGDHLVRSSKNSDRVRGQSRDSNNKNPDIIEWEEVEVNETPSHEELEFELQKLAYEERRAKQDQARQTLDNINYGLRSFNNILDYLNENPEVVAALVSGGQKLYHAISNFTGQAKNVIKSVFSRKEAGKTKAIEASVETCSSQASVLTIDSQPAVYNERVDEDSIEQEEMSIEEARRLVVNILVNYISMKRSIDLLEYAGRDGAC